MYSRSLLPSVSLLLPPLLFVCVVRNPAYLEWGFLLPSNYSKIQAIKSCTYQSNYQSNFHTLSKSFIIDWINSCLFIYSLKFKIFDSISFK